MPPQPPKEEVSQVLAEIKQFRTEISDNLARSEEILGLANSKLQTANALLQKAAEERAQVEQKQADLIKIARNLKIKEERLKQTQENIDMNIPFANPYPQR